jgi:hypothetical protein
MVVALTGHQSNLSWNIWADLGKGWKTWGNPYIMHKVWWLGPFFLMDTSCTPLQSVESLKSLGMDPLVVLTFYTNGSVMNRLWWDVYMSGSFILLSWRVNTSNNELIACHLRNTKCFSTNVQIPDNTLAPTKYLYVGIKSCKYEMYSWCYR